MGIELLFIDSKLITIQSFIPKHFLSRRIRYDELEGTWSEDSQGKSGQIHTEQISYGFRLCSSRPHRSPNRSKRRQKRRTAGALTLQRGLQEAFGGNARSQPHPYSRLQEQTSTSSPLSLLLSPPTTTTSKASPPTHSSVL